MNDILFFPSDKGEALVMDDNFDFENYRKHLISEIINCTTVFEADRILVSLYNEGILYGQCVDDDPKDILVETKYE